MAYKAQKTCGIKKLYKEKQLTDPGESRRKAYKSGLK